MTFQPHNHHQPQLDPQQSAKIIWTALTFSLVIYGAVLVFLGKISGLWFPGLKLTLLQEGSLLSCLVFLLTFTIYRKKVQTNAPFQSRFPKMVVCWALNEACPLFAFAVTMVESDGNGFFYVINATLAVLMNLVMFPKK